MSSIHFRLAQPADDANLRRLLRQHPLPGSVSLSFEREPSFFQASAIEGPFHQTMVSEALPNARLIGMGSRSVRPYYVDGAVRPLGYMSQLRMDQRYEWGALLARIVGHGFAFYRQLHADGRTPFYLMSIVADNQPALRLLNAGLRDFPRLQPLSELHTYALATSRVRTIPRPPAGVTLEAGSAAWCEQIVACLQRNGARKQFAPQWTAESLANPAQTPGLALDDFVLAVRAGRVIGCLARWDQQMVKQTVVRGYSGTLARWRWWINLAARIGGWPRLPAVNSPLHTNYASHLAVDGDDPQIAAALFGQVHRRAVVDGVDYLMVGLDARDPIAKVARGYRHLCYRSHLYLATWGDQAALPRADQCLVGVEVAML